MIYIPPGQQLCQSLPILISNFLIPPTTKFAQAAFLLGVGASSSVGHSHFLVDVNADTIPLRKLVKNLLTLEVLSVACYLNGTRSAPHTTPHIRSKFGCDQQILPNTTKCRPPYSLRPGLPQSADVPYNRSCYMYAWRTCLLPSLVMRKEDDLVSSLIFLIAIFKDWVIVLAIESWGFFNACKEQPNKYLFNILGTVLTNMTQT